MRATSFSLLVAIYSAMCLFFVCSHGIPLWHRLLKHRDWRKVKRWMAMMNRSGNERARKRIRVLHVPFQRLVEELSSGKTPNTAARSKQGSAGHRAPSTYDSLLRKLTQRRRKYERARTTSTYPSRYAILLNRRRLRHRKHHGTSRKRVSVYVERVRTRTGGLPGNKQSEVKHGRVRHSQKKHGRRKYTRLDKLRAKIERRKWFLSHYGGNVRNATASPWPYIVPCPKNDSRRFYCQNGGTCMYIGAMDVTTCKCPGNYRGRRCQNLKTKTIEDRLSHKPRLPTNVDWFS